MEEEEEWGRQPSFGSAADGVRRRCAAHRLPGDVDFKNRRRRREPL
jgi:hypothetical protein